MSIRKSLNVHISLSPEDQKLCHKILYQFFHGQIDNPVQAGKYFIEEFEETKPGCFSTSL